MKSNLQYTETLRMSLGGQLQEVINVVSRQKNCQDCDLLVSAYRKCLQIKAGLLYAVVCSFIHVDHIGSYVGSSDHSWGILK